MFNKLFLTLSTAVSNVVCHSEPCVRNLKQIRLRYLTFVRYDIAFNLAIMKQQLYFYNYHSFHCCLKCSLSFRTLREESQMALIRDFSSHMVVEMTTLCKFLYSHLFLLFLTLSTAPRRMFDRGNRCMDIFERAIRTLVCILYP